MPLASLLDLACLLLYLNAECRSALKVLLLHFSTEFERVQMGFDSCLLGSELSSSSSAQLAVRCRDQSWRVEADLHSSWFPLSSTELYC